MGLKYINLPKSTLERRVRKARNYENEDTHCDNDCRTKSLECHEIVFSKEQESELSQYVKSVEIQLFGITGKELRVLTYQLAETNTIKKPFNVKNWMALEYWLSSFLKRHPDLTYRHQEPISAARAMDFNQMAINEFFTLLEQVLDKYSLDTQQNI